jgi:hypothetical protein
MAFQSKNKLLTRLSLQGVIMRSVSITFIYLLFYILTETGTIFTRVLFMNNIYLTFRGRRMWCLPATRIYASFRVVVPTHPFSPSGDTNCFSVPHSMSSIISCHANFILACWEQHVVSYRIFFFLSRWARIFFQEFNIRLYVKIWIRLFFISSTKIRIFFSATLGIRIFF